MQRSVRMAKRVIDVVGSSVGLAITLPLYPFIAAAIYLESPGPIFIRQLRAGRLHPGDTSAATARRTARSSRSSSC